MQRLVFEVQGSRVLFEELSDHRAPQNSDQLGLSVSWRGARQQLGEDVLNLASNCGGVFGLGHVLCHQCCVGGGRRIQSDMPSGPRQ